MLPINQNMNNLLLVIQGPTASGKTALAVELAKKYNTVVFSADSRQCYKEISIGTAKPSSLELEGIKHYFIDNHSIHDQVTAATFVSEILPDLNSAFETKQLIILVGGSGMYIDALCYGLDELPVDPLIKNELNLIFKSEGLNCLLKELELSDPEYFNKVDRNNPVRVIRALEVIRVSGKTYSSYLNKTKLNRSFNFKKITIDLDRKVLYDRINKRVDEMIKSGLEAEARSVYEYKHIQSLQTVGYTEWFDFFDGKFEKKETIERIKQNTRRYAKRQLTWFRRDSSAIWLKSKDLNSQVTEVESIISGLKNEN